jgi:hypothetical protein
MRHAISVIGFASLVLFTLADVKTAGGQAQTPASASSPDPHSLVSIDTQAGHFNIPCAFLMSCETRGRNEDVSHPNSFSFAFWMPSGVPVDLGAIGLSTITEIRAGQFVIQIVQVRKIGQQESYDPSVLFTNSITPTTDYDFKSAGIFVEAISHYISATGLDIYFERQYLPAEHDVESMMIRCFDPSIADPPALCTGTVRNDALGVTYGLHIESVHLQDSVKAAQKAYDLLLSWKRIDSTR